MKHLTLTAVSLLLIGLTMSGTAYSQVPSWEREALIAFYNATDGDNWVRKDGQLMGDAGWLGASGTECSWYGVWCWDNKVTNLYLDSNNLTGSIPSEIDGLIHLSHLDLSSNQLVGQIPATIGNLSNLSYLQLGFNELTGPIPGELGNLNKLTRLMLHRNNLDGALPPALGNLYALRNLWLNDNNFSGNIPTEFGNLKNLEYLYLYNNSLTGTIPASLWNLPLSHFWAFGNQLSGSTPVFLNTRISLWLDDDIYIATAEWPNPYNGVKPDSSLDLGFNNIGAFNASDSLIYVCLQLYTDGLPSSLVGVSKFDIGFKIISIFQKPENS